MVNDTSESRSEIDLLDVLKDRVEVGEPIYIGGPTTQVIDAAIEGIGGEFGKPVKVVQIIDGPETILHRQSRPEK